MCECLPQRQFTDLLVGAIRLPVMCDISPLPVFPKVIDANIGTPQSARIDRKASYEPSRTLMSVPKTSNERSFVVRGATSPARVWAG
jgi:hypothetical protein